MLNKKDQPSKKETFFIAIKTFLAIAILIISATAIIGGGYLISKYEVGPGSEIAYQEAARENKIALQNELAVFEKESSLLDEIVETKNYALCEEIDKPDFCLNFITLLTEDANFCEKISKESEKERCLSELARQTGDWKICDNIKNRIFKNQCFVNAYHNLYDQTACELLDKDLTVVTRDQCYLSMALGKNEESLCKKAGEFSNSCYYTLAIEKGNMEICDEVTDSDLRNYCYYYNSIKNSSVRPCQLISEDGFKNLCLAEASEKSSYCDKIGDSQLKKYCFKMIAHRTNDVELCDHNRDCVVEFAVKNNEYDLCENLNNYTAIKDCKMIVAVENENSDEEHLCQSSSPKAENYCFFELAVKTGNEEYCRKIKDQEFGEVLDVTNDKCFLRLARVAADRTICDNIVDKPTKDGTVPNQSLPKIPFLC